MFEQETAIEREDIGTRTSDPLRSQIETVRPRPRSDRQIWGIYAALVFISLIELYSASAREIVGGNILGPVMRHALLLFMGFIIMLVLQRIPYRQFSRFAYVIAGLAVLSVFYTMFFGITINNARRAFSLFGLCTVQPSELIKFSAALLFARILCGYVVKYTPGHEEEEKKHNRRLVAWIAGIVLFFGALLISQGLTNTIVMMFISGSMMVLGGVRVRELAVVLAVYAVIGGLYGAYKYTDIKEALFHRTTIVDGRTVDANTVIDRRETHKNRMSGWLKPDKYNDPITSDNAQEQYSFIAQANGGVLGRFPGNSRETSRLPLAFSDYIYAIIVEDMGLIGGLGVMALYLWLLARAGRIASQCKKTLPALLVVGMAVFIVSQALVHMGIVTGAFPVSGQPLPLISKGGSSVIVTSVALGVMLSVSRYALRKGVKQEANENVRALTDSDNDNESPDNPTQI